MIITNRLNLSEAWVRAARDSYDYVGWRSVTELIGPPRISELKRRHDAEIEVDVIDLISSIFGEAMHEILRKAGENEKGVITEQRLVFEVEGKEVSMKFDRYQEEDEHLKDYKSEKISGYMHDVKHEWKCQTNSYAVGIRKILDRPVSRITIETLLKDWSLSQLVMSKKKGDFYPESPIVKIPINVWDEEEAERYLAERVQLHARCEQLHDNDLPFCTEDDRWVSENLWKVYKKPNLERAVRGGAKFTNPDEAEAFAEHKGPDHVVIHRPSESTRCLHYCPMRKFCNQYNTEICPPF